MKQLIKTLPSSIFINCHLNFHRKNARQNTIQFRKFALLIYETLLFFHSIIVLNEINNIFNFFKINQSLVYKKY